jgi:hypothetical protein
MKISSLLEQVPDIGERMKNNCVAPLMTGWTHRRPRKYHPCANIAQRRKMDCVGSTQQYHSVKLLTHRSMLLQRILIKISPLWKSVPIIA